MEKWITRSMGVMVALGALGLFWTCGMLLAVIVEQGRLTSLSGTELQLIGISLLGGLAVAWGALHLFSLADRETSPRIYTATRIAMLLAALAAAGVGASWSLARVAA
jgi:hypothetical protein